MAIISTARLDLIPLSHRMIRERLLSDRFELELEDGRVAHFPASWPGDPLVVFPRFLESSRDPVPGSFVALDRDTAAVVGKLGTVGTLSDGVQEFGYGFGVEGRGYATEAVGGLVQELLATPEVAAVMATTAVANISSQRVLEKNGFERIGTSSNEDDGDLIVWERRA